ncbi:hypothetical protein AMECASPLE_016009 [Ameca splendens]|uniref:Uncharacterized protein n=1 Tax=Ameca splendens TaxID=208324 RepID=A0ABV0XQW0_9TELE
MDGEHSALSGVERERERLPPIYTNCPPAVLGRGPKQPFPTLGTFISTLSQRRDVGGRGFAVGIGGTMTGSVGIRHIGRQEAGEQSWDPVSILSCPLPPRFALDPVEPNGGL